MIRDVLEAYREEMDLSGGTIYTYENVLLSFVRANGSSMKKEKMSGVFCGK